MVSILDGEYLTVPEAARVLQVSASTVWRWIASGKLSAYRVGPRKIRVKKEDVLAMVTPVGKEEAPPPRSRTFATELLSFAGIWKDLDADGLIAEIYRARHEAPPSPPVT